MLEFYKFDNNNKNKSLSETEKETEPVHFDIIMLDLNMPIMNGYEACKQILQIYQDYNQTQIRNKESLYRINSMMCIN